MTTRKLHVFNVAPAKLIRYYTTVIRHYYYTAADTKTLKQLQ